MGNKKNIVLEKLTENELKQVNGGAWKCPPLPSYIKPNANSSVYQAWLMANCTNVQSCTPNTWTYCG